MTTTRTGPSLTLAATCNGCAHVDARPSGSAFEAFCDHVRAPERNTIQEAGELGTIETPAWCPELAAARATLGHDLIGDAPARCPACGEPVSSDCLPVMEGRWDALCWRCLTPFAIRATLAYKAELLGGGQ